jgi:hypothetical protein
MDDDAIDKIVGEIEDQNQKDLESSATIRLRKEIKETEKKIEILIDQLETGVNSSRVAGRLKQREDELEALNKQLQKEQAKQIKIDPVLARSFLLSIRECSRNDLEYQKLLVNLLINRIYLYDDHFDIFLNNSDRKGKVSDYEAADIERYFDNNPDSSSITLESGTP